MDLLDLEGLYWELQQDHVTLQREAASLREDRELSRMAQEDSEQRCLARAQSIAVIDRGVYDTCDGRVR